MNNKGLFNGIFRVCLQLNIIYNLLSLYSICYNIMSQFVKKRKCVYSNAVEEGKACSSIYIIHPVLTAKASKNGVKCHY